ncbi:hypothetical protein [Archangium minus]|uniref:hypothetical protein n=1 Tax=Archangium minus TaxID=83450 RepID=UPI0037C0E241
MEVFIRGLYPAPLVERDVVSLYPSAARHQPLPHEKTKWVHVTTADEVHTLECSATTTPPHQRQLHLPIQSDGSRR